MNAAKNARLSKERSPELYCPVKGCLWLVQTNKGPNPCRNHPQPKATRMVCSECGEYKDEDTGDGYHQLMESGHEQNSANPSGMVPLPWEPHVWVEER